MNELDNFKKQLDLILEKYKSEKINLINFQDIFYIHSKYLEESLALYKRYTNDNPNIILEISNIYVAFNSEITNLLT